MYNKTVKKITATHLAKYIFYFNVAYIILALFLGIKAVFVYVSPLVFYTMPIGFICSIISYVKY